MIHTGILNPLVASLLRRVRHTNTLVIADRGFPSWKGLETVDLSLVDGIPTVPQVLQAISADYVIGKAWMAEDFLTNNPTELHELFSSSLGGLKISHEPHNDLKLRVPGAVGLIRTGDTTQYANIVLESA